jgi:hypothetical protein
MDRFSNRKLEVLAKLNLVIACLSPIRASIQLVNIFQVFMTRTNGNFYRALMWCLLPAVVVLFNRLIEGLLYWLSGWSFLKRKVWRDIVAYVASGAILGYSIVGVYRIVHYRYGAYWRDQAFQRVFQAKGIGALSLSLFEVSVVEDGASILWWIFYTCCVLRDNRHKELLNSSLKGSRSSVVLLWGWFSTAAIVGVMLRLLLPYTYIEALSER